MEVILTKCMEPITWTQSCKTVSRVIENISADYKARLKDTPRTGLGDLESSLTSGSPTTKDGGPYMPPAYGSYTPSASYVTFDAGGNEQSAADSYTLKVTIDYKGQGVSKLYTDFED